LFRKEELKAKRRVLSGIMITLLLMGSITLAFDIQPARANGTIYIRADGNIDPPTAPIQRAGDLYTLTDNIFSDAYGIVVERSNTTLDGDGYTLHGSGEPDSRGIWVYFFVDNVTIQNMNIRGFHAGIYLTDNDDCVVRGNNVRNNTVFGIYIHHSHYGRFCDNNITNNGDGLHMVSNVLNNTFVRNNIASNDDGVILSGGYMHNRFYHNNFLDNSRQVYGAHMELYVNYFDNGYPAGGNYWSDYNGNDTYSGLGQNLTGHDGIGDTSYVIGGNYLDNYPLMNPPNILEPHVPITDPSLNRLPFRLSIEPVVSQSQWLDEPPGQEFMAILYKIAGRPAQVLAKVAPHPADIVVKIWYVLIADTDGNGLEPEEIVGVLMDAILDDLKHELMKMNIEYMLGLKDPALLQAAFTSIQYLSTALFIGRTLSSVTAQAAVTKVGIFMPVSPEDLMKLLGVGGFCEPGEPWTDIGCGIGSSERPYMQTACPVDLKIVDSGGRVLNKTHNEIPGAYYLESDFNRDGSLEDMISLPESADNYTLTVIAEPEANESDTYTLILGNDGFGLTLQDNATIGSIPENGFTIETYDSGFLEGIRDVSVKDANLSHTVIGQGYNLSIASLVENDGMFTETMNITLYANSTAIQTIFNITVASSNSSVVRFHWNTTNSSRGSYRIKVCVHPLSGESRILNNNSTYTWVFLTIPGDVNGDRIVEIHDLSMIGKAYGSTPFSPNWNPNADVNGDELVDTFEIETMGAYWGESW